MLKVVGESMIDAAICDGDWVVVRQQNVAENGDIVAAMIDGEATVKTFKRTKKEVWLMPHNDLFEPIPGNNAVILGKVSRSCGRSEFARTLDHKTLGPGISRGPESFRDDQRSITRIRDSANVR